MRRILFIVAALSVVVGSCESPTKPATGRIIWHVAGRGWGTPAFDATTVYFVGFNHEVVAVDRNTGALRWRGHSADGGESTNGRSVVIAADVVAFGDARIWGFDRRTGAVRWQFGPGGDQPGLYYLSTDGQTVFAGSPEGRVYAIDGASGVQRWMTVIADDGITATFNPVLSDGTLFVCVKRFSLATVGGVVAVDALTGAVRWSRDLPAAPFPDGSACEQKVAVSGDFVIAASDVGRLYGLDRATGEILWSDPKLSALPPGTYGSPDTDVRPIVASGDVVVAGSTTGYLVAYDATTGVERWRATAARGSVTYPLSADGDAVYATHSGLQLAAFDIATGKLRWRAGDNPGGGEFYPAPAVDTDRLFVSGLTGFYALRK